MPHYDDIIMGMMASQITSLMIVYSNVYSGIDQRKHQSSASLAFVWGIHRGLVNSPHKWPVMRKMFPFDDIIMIRQKAITPATQRAKFMGPTLGPPSSGRPQMGPICWPHEPCYQGGVDPDLCHHGASLSHNELRFLDSRTPEIWLTWCPYLWWPIRVWILIITSGV